MKECNCVNVKLSGADKVHVCSVTHLRINQGYNRISQPSQCMTGKKGQTACLSLLHASAHNLILRMWPPLLWPQQNSGKKAVYLSFSTGIWLKLCFRYFLRRTTFSGQFLIGSSGSFLFCLPGLLILFFSSPSFMLSLLQFFCSMA